MVSLDLTSVRKSFIPSVDWESPHAETEPRARGARVITVARKRLRDRKNERTIMAQRNYRRTCRTYSAVQIAAAAVGAVFFLVGILGFIPGVTTDYDMLTGAGHHSGAKLLGIFEVSVLHNVVHLLFGVAGLAMARMARSAQAYLIGGGIIYLVLWIYGMLIDQDSSANFVPVNDADNWLHFGLGVGMVAVGFLIPPLAQRESHTDSPIR